jgi:prepilin peptidase CpaA
VWINLLLALVLAVCVVTDVRSRKIYNAVLGPAYLAAFASNTALGGWPALKGSLLGFVTGLGILLIPSFLGGIGAGDVKLLALVGAMKDTGFVLEAAVYMALAGGLIALLVIMFSKGMGERLRSLAYLLYGLRHGILLPFLIRRDMMSGSYPYGIAIAAGAALCYLPEGWSVI